MDTQTSYDQVASEYVRHVYDELKDKPLDRVLLDRFADSVGSKGLVCDMGCGPGQVARYLSDRGLQVCGLDLAPNMVAQATQLNPGLSFQQGTMLALQAPAATYAGLTAFYSLIHFTPAQLPVALSELFRVLQPGGFFLLSFHVGNEVRHFDQLWEQPVNLDFFFFQPAHMQAALETAGFKVIEIIERPPYENVEVQTQRAYIFARKSI
jgi:SAM-dependent methyltransferase